MKKLILISSVIFGLLFFSSSNNISAATLLQDDFESQNYNNWNVVVGNGLWSIQNVQNSYRFGGNIGTPSTGIEAEAGDFSWSNYRFSVDLLPISGADRNLIFRATNQRVNMFNLNLPVAYGLHMYSNHIWLQKFTQNGYVEPASVDTTLPLGVPTKITVEANENHIKVFIGDSTNPIIDWIDTNNPILQGKVGLLITTGAAYPSQVWFDNVLVTDLPISTPTPTATPVSTPTPSPLPSLNVPDIKQYSSPWGNQVYDQALSWTTNPFIKNWGCALTSATMILQYYGFPLNPGQLNSWLIRQVDGYVRNGLINWLAISRYTKVTPSSPTYLEFRRLTSTTENLINELINSRPAILEEPGHFIVAKGQTPSGFTINDPGYSNRLTLDSYSNSFNSIGSYIPSQTDLSYIMLTLNPQFGLKVFGVNNNEITGNTYIQDPLVDDISASQTSGNPLRIFMFPKPPVGSYKVEITGNGIYQLDSYLYDLNGSVNLKKVNGILGENQTDNLVLTIGKNNKTIETITIESLKNDVLAAKNSGKIRSNAVFNQINTFLNLASRILTYHQLQSAKVTLNATILYIRAYTPSQIDNDVSRVLQSEIQSFTNSL